MNHTSRVFAFLCILLLSSVACASDSKLEQDFRNLPMSARRMTGPLFWLHGDESKERLEQFVNKVVESGNGTFTPESRPHSDWLGKGWFRDLGICLDQAKKHDLTMWIFDEKWWPSGMVGGKVPEQFSSKAMNASDVIVDGLSMYTGSGYGKNLIAVIAGRETPDGIDSTSLIDLTAKVSGDNLTWNAPSGRWKMMKFTWEQRPGLVDGASRDCVEWYIRTVYQPHYDHFKADFGKTIKGFFYDEPETRGDWGTEVLPMLNERGVDWKKALVAYKFELAGDDQIAARYQYYDAFAESWGRTLYGGLQDWCTDHNTTSMGHFLEHDQLYLSTGTCAGNMFQLQKYSGMGGIDLVCQQMYPGQRPFGVYQIPKLGSSIAHAYGKKDDITMCEMFGAYGQDITYPQMKWLTDHMQVRGVNYMIPHSFNPRAPYDVDCPPYFDNGGFEPRWPLYRVYADYTSRLSLMLSGGKHVCPIALLYLSNSSHVGKYVTPEAMTTAIQDAAYDCDWLPYDVLEKDAKINGRELALHNERYKVMIVPPVEVIPYGTLTRVKEFFDSGGVVIGYGFTPSKSATIGKGSSDIAWLVNEIWGESKASLEVCKTSAAGGRSYFLPENPSSEDLQHILAANANIKPDLEVVKGETNHWLHVLHRVKDGKDIFFVCNQNWQDKPRRFTFRVHAPGYPECWDAMRNEITSIPFTRIGDSVDMDLTLQPSESVMIVMQPKQRDLPVRLDGAGIRPVRIIKVKGSTSPVVTKKPVIGPPPPLQGYAWIWFSNENLPGKTFYRRHLQIPEGSKIKSAKFLITCDNEFTLFINGKQSGKSEGWDIWQVPATINIAKFLRAGENTFAIEGRNLDNKPNPAGLIGKCNIELDNGKKIDLRIDRTWKTSDNAADGWQETEFDDSAWHEPIEVAKYGDQPFGILDGASMLTLSPVMDTTFKGTCTIPASLKLKQFRVCLEADDIGPEAAASITVNGHYAGGFIGKPFRLDVTDRLKPGTNSIIVAPFAPEGLRLTVYPK